MTPAGGHITISVPANVAVDRVGNFNRAAEPLIVRGRLVPFLSAPADQVWTAGVPIESADPAGGAWGHGALHLRAETVPTGAALPDGLQFDATTRVLSGTPSEATAGAVTLTYEVTDDDGDTYPATFEVTVHPAPPALDAVTANRGTGG